MNVAPLIGTSHRYLIGCFTISGVLKAMGINLALFENVLFVVIITIIL